MSERITWRKAALFAIFGAALASACVVSSDDGDGVDDDDGGSSNAGGTTGKAGSAGSGGSTAGSTAGGTTGEGGEGGAMGGAGGEAPDDMSPTCDGEGEGGGNGIIGTPGSCEPVDDMDECQLCIQDNCCTQYEECVGYEPYNVCGWGGPGDWPQNGGEFLCYQACINENYDPEGAGGLDDVITPELENECIAECATPSCSNIPGVQTQELALCMRDCEDVCYN